MNNSTFAVKPKTATRTAVASLVAGVLIVLTTGCGTSSTETPTSSPTATSTPSPTSTIAGTSVNGFATKKELAVDAQGRRFVQTTLSANDSLLEYDPSIRTLTVVDMFTEEEVQAAQKAASSYYVEQYIDSILKGDNITQKDKDLWLEQNKEIIDPEQFQSFVDDFKVNTGVDTGVYMNRERSAKGYSLVYGENEVQVLSRDVSYTKIIGQNIEGKDYIGFEADVTFALAVTKDGKKATENVAVSGEVNLRQVKPGEWKIAGVQLHVDSVTYGE